METNKSGRSETDERFPTGEWVGFWLQRPHITTRQRMELALAFADGSISGEGEDSVGPFALRGRYDRTSGKVVIHKFYVGSHHVLYDGWAELDKGIWGVWSIGASSRDGFHMWPKGMKDPTQNELAVELSEPQAAEQRALVNAQGSRNAVEFSSNRPSVDLPCCVKPPLVTDGSRLNRNAARALTAYGHGSDHRLRNVRQDQVARQP